MPRFYCTLEFRNEQGLCAQSLQRSEQGRIPCLFAPFCAGGPGAWWAGRRARRFREAAAGEIKPRQVLILVEWTSREAFESYCNDPGLADLHPHRINGTSDYVWHLFDKLEDLRPLLK